jgi:hypothetical protein
MARTLLNSSPLTLLNAGRTRRTSGCVYCFNGNRNQPRKRIDLTVKGFIEFAKDKPDARLWLNMGAKDMGWEIIPLFKRVARDAGTTLLVSSFLPVRIFPRIIACPLKSLTKFMNLC